MATNSTIDSTTYATYRGALSVGNFDGADGAAVELVFANGEKLFMSTGNLPSAILWQAAAHGLKQKLVDAAAISRNPDTGRSATVDDKYAAVKEVYDRLLSGEWNKRREGGKATSGGLLFRALCRMYPTKTPEQLRVFLDAKSAEEQAALRKNPKVAAIIEEIKAEQADTDGVDADALLGELE